MELETYNAFENMAIDEAILKARIENLVPNTLRLYRWSPSAVSIGRFQEIEKEVQLDNCRKYGVDVVRRMTGGGTVYHDAADEITYSLIATKKDLMTDDISELYARIYSGLAAAIQVLGIRADFDPGSAKACPNLTVNGKKISGSAQVHKNGVVMQHGTLLLRVNLERMFTFLRVPWAETRMQVVNVAKNKITSIDAELGRNVSVAEIGRALADGFEKALDTEFKSGKLTVGELENSKALCKQKYSTDVWNFCGKNVQKKHTTQV